MSLEFPAAFIFTNVIEILAATSLLKKEEPKRVLSVILLLNVVTLPFVWFVFPAFFQGNYFQVLAFSELPVFVFEAAAYSFAFKKTSVLKAASVAVAANAASFLFGLLV